mmetsp:Transcript_11195/g.24685  ORF Transcript_11195/g.24685 Transcript_11195/m.24685 type:complete len:200 (+) Transcript_11195:400-999(+)
MLAEASKSISKRDALVAERPGVALFPVLDGFDELISKLRILPQETLSELLFLEEVLRTSHPASFSGLSRALKGFACQNQGLELLPLTQNDADGLGVVLHAPQLVLQLHPTSTRSGLVLDRTEELLQVLCVTSRLVIELPQVLPQRLFCRATCLLEILQLDTATLQVLLMQSSVLSQKGLSISIHRMASDLLMQKLCLLP